MLMNIILYLLQLCHQLYQQNCWLINFICRYIPLKQWAFDDSHSPRYQKFKVDQLPKIIYHHQDWDWKDLNSYYTWKYGKPVTPVRPVPAPSVRLPSPTCTEITVKPDSSCARSAADGFLRTRTVLPGSSLSSAPTVPIR